LVAILSADKEGVLRSEKSLIQTIGRAARNVSGEVHMYADSVTDSMSAAIDETNRRRAKQVAYNLANGIDPQPIRKKIADITDMLAREDVDTNDLLGGRQRGRGRAPVPSLGAKETSAQARRLAGLPAGDLADLIQELTTQMHAAAADLQFELAARLRDEIRDLKGELRQMVEANR
jgi:excinuclease ABC subunit B